MYNVYNKSDIYFKYNLSEDKITLIGNISDFLKEIYLMFNEVCKYDKTEFPENIQITGNDVCNYYTHEIRRTDNTVIEKPNSVLRNILYLDGYFSTIDPRNYIEEAFNIYGQKEFHKGLKQSRKQRLQFRSGAMPNISCRKGGSYHTKRCRGIRRIFALVSDVEYGKYIRHKAIPFNGSIWCDDYDGGSIRRHDSWKNQKKRKQWM